MSLPAELRLRIYEHLSDGPTLVSFPGFRNKRNHLVIIKILLTCRLLYREFLPVAYREINLGVHTQRFKAHVVPLHQAWTGSFTWTGSSEPGQPPVEYQGDPLSSEDRWPEFTRACGNVIRKISMRYKQTSYLKETLQEVVEYAESSIEHFPRLDLLDVHIIIQNWGPVKKDLSGLKHRGGPDPVQLLVQSLDVKLPRQLKISFSLNQASSASWTFWEETGIDGTRELETRLLAALETMR